jgi:ubiquinone/menaquinone biosynthesis C-methylase UbiE
VGSFALHYDTVENHGWYANLEPTVEQLDSFLQAGQTLIDYSGGTGILTERLLQRWGNRDQNILIVDSSPKFLRLALDKFESDPRVAFRRIRFLRDEKRLQHLHEVVPTSLRESGVHALVSTNAIHLYNQLEQTASSWYQVLRPGSRIFIQSGNIDHPGRNADEWIIDDTVHHLHRTAVDIVRSGAYEAYRHHLDDEKRMAAYDALRHKYFLPVRPSSHYINSLQQVGFVDLQTTTSRIEAHRNDWADFLCAYHEGVLGWIGGVEKIEGTPPTDQAVQDRISLLRTALSQVFENRKTFFCCWTYITGRRP